MSISCTPLNMTFAFFYSLTKNLPFLQTKLEIHMFQEIIFTTVTWNEITYRTYSREIFYSTPYIARTSWIDTKRSTPTPRYNICWKSLHNFIILRIIIFIIIMRNIILTIIILNIVRKFITIIAWKIFITTLTCRKIFTTIICTFEILT